MPDNHSHDFYDFPEPPHPPEAVMAAHDWVELVQTLGAPLIFAGVCVWFIKYMYDQQVKNTKEFFDRDEKHDEKLYELAEKSSEALGRVAGALDANTSTMEVMISTMTSTPTRRRKQL